MAWNLVDVSKLQCPGGVCPPQARPPIVVGGYAPQQKQPQAQADVPAWIVAASVRVSRQGWKRDWSGLAVNEQGLPIMMAGTGVIVQVDGASAYIVTNRHVCPKDQAIKVAMPSGATLDAVWLGVDDVADLAAIKIEGDAATPFVPLADGSPTKGAAVFQVGYPGGRGPVKRTGNYVGFNGGTVGGAKVIEVKCWTDHGDSGSGVFAQDTGRLVALVWGGIDKTDNTSCVGLDDLRRFTAKCFQISAGTGKQPAKQPQSIMPARRASLMMPPRRL